MITRRRRWLRRLAPILLGAMLATLAAGRDARADGSPLPKPSSPEPEPPRIGIEPAPPPPPAPGFLDGTAGKWRLFGLTVALVGVMAGIPVAAVATGNERLAAYELDNLQMQFGASPCLHSTYWQCSFLTQVRQEHDLEANAAAVVIGSSLALGILTTASYWIPAPSAPVQIKPGPGNVGGAVQVSW